MRRPDDNDVVELLTHGTLDIRGRLVDASNATLLCDVELDGATATCVYKPVRGERPLWDFPDGTLAGREHATYLISQACHFDLVPPTVLRPGPLGPGMAQLWIDTREDDDLVELVPADQLRPGRIPVLHATSEDGEPLVVAHRDHPALRLMAAFDALVNNADRKGGHVLHAPDGHVYGVDHGICLHAEDKLRTVLWGWESQPLPDQAIAGTERLLAGLDGDLGETLHEHLTRAEVWALGSRAKRLIATGTLPAVDHERDWPAIPWPPF
ncbi:MULTISPECIES: SCO1664 family protein [Actinosynnema]|uniref:Phosphatidylinositol kinase n=1 Tax=Actinosynnema pretiosum TaxID=42197 RepID=A0A290Z753_9PSEU|nr:SCO1664 family protein [Actinosynnema pretiosum]ATE54857.1 phosphatidylinositol kinase [Actinosynnema pretiosum]